MVVIEWDAVLIDNPATDENELYWVSAGAEYNYENDIWVGQASFNVNTTMPVSVIYLECNRMELEKLNVFKSCVLLHFGLISINLLIIFFFNRTVNTNNPAHHNLNEMTFML